MQLMQCILFLLLTLVVEIKSSIQNGGPLLDTCFPTKRNELPFEDKVKLKKSVTCKGVNHVSQIMENVAHDVEEIIILDSNIYSEDIEKDAKLDLVLSIKLINSFFNSAIMEWMSSMKQLQFLTVWESANSFIIRSDNLNITTLNLDLTVFKNLQMIHISKGNITDMKMKLADKVPQLYLEENFFDCGNDFIWLLEARLRNPHKVNLNDTYCFMRKIDEFVDFFPLIYSLKGKPFIPIVEYMRETKVNCPPKCICELKGLLNIERPQLNVDCIELNMTKLPDVIPKGASRCNFSYNFIEDLTPLYKNQLYDKVAMMILSHNHINFLDPVLFPDLLLKRRDVGFWLDHNRLTKFPAESVRKVYDNLRSEDRFMPQFILADNPYICSCDYVGQFQNLIYQHMYNIFDSRDIMCSKDDPYNPEVKILSLDVGALCHSEPIMNKLDIVNIVLSLLLIILIIDFMYKNYQYKKHRRLPWIVTKFKFQV